MTTQKSVITEDQAAHCATLEWFGISFQFPSC